MPASDLLALLVVAAFVLFGASMVRSRRGQASRLRRLERGLAPPEPPPSHRPVPLRQLGPPHEARQPALEGTALPGGLMAWTRPLEPGPALQAILEARDGLCAYLGSSPEEVARFLAPEPRFRENLYVPPPSSDPARDLEGRLDRGTLPGLPWVVADPGCPLEGLRRLHRRYGCSILLLCDGPAPEGFRPLPEAR